MRKISAPPARSKSDRVPIRSGFELAPANFIRMVVKSTACRFAIYPICSLFAAAAAQLPGALIALQIGGAPATAELDCAR